MTMIERLENLLWERGDVWTSSGLISDRLGTPCASTRISDLRKKLIKDGAKYEIESRTVHKTVDDTHLTYGEYRIVPRKHENGRLFR